MAYFYGWTNEYIENMPCDEFGAYYSATLVLQKRNLLDSIDANLTPNLKRTKIKSKVENLQREIKNSFVREISSVNEQYLAQEYAKEMQDG